MRVAKVVSTALSISRRRGADGLFTCEQSGKSRRCRPVVFPATAGIATAAMALTGVSAVAQQAQTAEANQDAIADIVVTAQRIESRASKTPIALTAINGEALRDSGVTNPTQLGDHVPDVSIDRVGGMRITIRGVTSTDSSEKGDPSAAFMLDGIYIARPQVQDVSFFDIARVEVLRGPQGTLYGRNTTAGVVNVISNRPTNKLEAALNAAAGDFGTYQADAMVNAPVNDVVAVRAAVAYDRRDNYLRTAPGDPYGLGNYRNNVSGRLQALFQFSESMNLLLKTDYSSIRGNEDMVTVRATNFYDLTDRLNPRYVGGSSASLRTLTYKQLVSPSQSNDTWGVSGEFNWNLGPLGLTYLGSHRQYIRDEQWTGYTSRPAADLFHGGYEQNSHELRFATTGNGPLTGQFGAYYFDERSGIAFFLHNAIPGTPYFGFPQDPTKSKSYAFFGQSTYSFRPDLRLTGGVRYSHDDKSRVGATAFQQTLTYNPATDRRLLNSAAKTFSKTTWRVGLDYDLNASSLLFASVSTGYKAGGFNDGCAAGTVTNGQPCNQPRPLAQLYYAPETLTAYEMGIKTRLADNRLQLNGSTFLYNYRNLQLSTVANFGGGPAQTTTNAGKAKVKGVELEAIASPNFHHRLEVSASYLNAYYVEYFPLGSGSLPDYAGRPLDHSPKFVIGAGYTYTYALARGDSISAGVYSRYSDSYVVTAFGTPAQFGQPSYTKTDVNLTYTGNDDRWYTQVFGKNLENKVLVLGVDSFNNVTPGDPRTLGVRAGVKF